MSGDVLARGARGGGTVVLGQVARLLIQLAGTVLLSRLLSPADFGLIAMVTVFTSLGALLRDFGISTAALQAKTLSHQQASNLFWMNTALSAVIGSALALATPLLVLLYDEPRLGVITPVLCLALFVSGVQAQIQMQLVRAMRFLAVTTTDIIVQLTALGAALLAAVAGWGYWALVVQALASSILLLVIRFLVARWVPTRPRRGHGSKVLFQAGGEFGLAQLLAYAANNTDTIVTGARWGSTDLGYYNRAFQLYMLPRSGVLDPLTQVAVPTVNAATSDGSRRPTDLLLRVQFLLSAVLTWVYLVAATTADWLIPVVLGDQWGASVAVFQSLCIAGAFATFSTVAYWTFILAQQSRQLLYLHLITKPLAVVLILVAAPFGIEAIALAYSAGLALAWPINLVWLARTAQQDSWAFFRMGLRVMAAGAVGFLLSRWLLGALVGLNPWLMIVIGAALATLFYLLAIVVVPGGRRELSTAARSAATMLRRGRG